MLLLGRCITARDKPAPEVGEGTAGLGPIYVRAVPDKLCFAKGNDSSKLGKFKPPIRRRA